MMLAANVLTDTTGAAEDRDVEGAIIIWSAVATMADAPEDRDRALRTMMDVASRFVSEPADGRVHATLALWHAVHRLAPTGIDQRRVLKTVMDIHEHRGLHTAADAAFRQAAEVDPDNPRAWQARGRG